MNLLLQSDIPGILWPAIPSVARAPVLALLQQLEHTQWRRPEQLRARQLDQVRALIEHARRTSPFWRDRIEHAALPRSDALDWAAFSRLPLLRRSDVQTHFDTLRSNAPPADHGKLGEGRTSGSTAMPIRVLSTQLQGLLWNAFTIRDALWQARDFTTKLAAIRNDIPRAAHANWGPPYDGLIATGPAVTEDVMTDIEALFDWLSREDPGCLVAYPTLLRELLRISIERDVQPRALRLASTYGEAVPDELRSLLAQHWPRVRLADIYSASECGHIALQCPQTDAYHVQSEGVLLEVLDETGRPCAPGEVGRVVLTVLHSFALPLIRYDIGDYAEVGPACSCGRGLPVLRRIMGRQRNMIRLPDGRRFWPNVNMFMWHTRFGVRQLRIVQTALADLRVEIVPDAARTLDAADIVAFLQERLGYPVNVDVVRVERLERSAASRKFEDVVSEIA